MNKLYLLVVFWATFSFGQTWKTISLSEEIRFDFPKIHTEKDSANFKVFSAESEDGSLVVTRTIERTHTFSWDDRGILEIYDTFQKEVLERDGGELVTDEVVEFQTVKTAKFAVRKVEDATYTTNYYMVFYYKGHVFTFELSDRTGKSGGWNNKLYNEINIANNKPQAAVESKIAEINYIDKAILYLPFIALFLILPAAIVVFLILWKRHKENRSNIT